MPRPSPQTDRVRWIINLFTTAPHDSFTLAQIARHLGVSKATCLPAVASLTRAGWLVRHPARKTYRLGPALIEIGRAAEIATPAEGLAAGLLEVCAETGLNCIAWQVSGNDLVLSEIVGPTGPRAQWAGLERGHRLKPVAPLGSALVAWSDDEAIERWIASAGGSDPVAMMQRLRPAIDAVRARGYAVELQDQMIHDVFRLVERLRVTRPGEVDDLVDAVSRGVSQRLADQEYVLGNLDTDEVYEPVSINAPVFGRYGEVDLIVCLVDFLGCAQGADISCYGDAVRHHAEALTASMNGALPDSWPSA